MVAGGTHGEHVRRQQLLHVKLIPPGAPPLA
jgi:hypothetical protein